MSTRRDNAIATKAAYARAMRAKAESKKPAPKDAPPPKENPFLRIRRKLDEERAARISNPSGLNAGK